RRHRRGAVAGRGAGRRAGDEARRWEDRAQGGRGRAGAEPPGQRRGELMARRSLAHALVLLALVVSSACGYSLAGRGAFLPPHIKVIGVPLFTNNTSVFDAERRITERVRSELSGRGRYRVETAAEGADAVLTGEISSIRL